MPEKSDLNEVDALEAFAFFANIILIILITNQCRAVPKANSCINIF